MKTQQILACNTHYRRGVTAWGKLEELLKAIFLGDADRPSGATARRSLEAATGHLQVLGEALAVVPGLVEDLAEERRIGELLRRQAAEHGIVFRYEDSSG